MEPVISGMSTCSLAIEILNSSVNDKASCAVCSVQDKNIKSCSNCKLIHYCSVQHQKEHWKIHKKNCFPIREESHSELGTILVATRNIKEGELIYEENPVLASACARFLQDGFSAVCFGCCRLLEKKFLNCKQLCEHCSWPLCGTNCSKIIDHSNFECKVFVNAGLKPIEVIGALVDPDESFSLDLFYQSVQVLKCLLLRENDLAAWNKLVKIHPLLMRRQLMPFTEEHSKFVTKFVREFCKLEQFPPDLVRQVFGITLFNRCTKSTPETDDKKHRLCISTISEKASKLSHSCIPNSEQRTSTNATSCAFAIRDIERGQIITESLGPDALMVEDVVGRRKYLHDNYFFWCSCTKCADPTELGAFSSGVKCHKINKTTKKECDGFYLPLNSLDTNSRWKCTNPECGSLKSYEILRKETLLPLHDEIFGLKTLQDKMEILETNSNRTVHENHAYLVYLRHEMVTKCVVKLWKDPNDPNFKELNAQLLDLIEKCLDLYNNFGLGIQISKGELLFNKALAIERTLPPGSFLGMFQPTPKYLECVRAAVDFIRNTRLETVKPPFDNLGTRWFVLKKAHLKLLKDFNMRNRD